MTNVKLKLIFLLLNALFAADIIHARPYSDNATDIVIKFSNNNTYELPIDANSDTLTVVNDDKRSNSNMEDLLNAEQDRDQDLSETVMKDCKDNFSDTDKQTNTQMKALLNAQLGRDFELNRTMEAQRGETLAESNQRINSEMDAIMNAEVGRDDDVTKREMKVKDAEAYTHLEAIVNAEQNRDEQLSTKHNVRARLETRDIPINMTNEHLDAIMSAEHGRDVDIAQKVMPDTKVLVLEIPEHQEEEFEKQLNSSSPLLEDIINAETDREDTLTDILFRPESEFVESPRFEFLIAGKINESDLTNKSAKGASVNNLERSDKNISSVLRKVDYVELVEVLRPISSDNKSAYNLANITGHELDNDLAPDTRFSDVQTLFLASLITVLPLLFGVATVLMCRCMCRRCCPGRCRKKESSVGSESSEKDDNDANNHQTPKSPTEGGSVVTEGEGPPSNGSIFTMTLKNNHLIVESEERNDITKNGRETKMKYSPDNEGIFVVEVQQSTAYRPNKSLQNSPALDPQISTNQALIHRNPEDHEKKIEEDSEKSSEKFDKALALSSTGLSISDLSMSSVGSYNVSYSYGSQLGYDQGPFGYPAGYDENDIEIVHDHSQEPLISKTPTDPDKPVVTAAIFKQDSIIGNDVLHNQGYCIEGSSDGPLLSDIQARELSLQHLHDIREKKLENGVDIHVHVANKVGSPKKFVRADSLPVQMDPPDIKVEIDKPMETINENEVELLHESFNKGKRTSLPIIRTDVYETVKDVLKTGSPKFEKLSNDATLGEGSFDQPPMITITEETETTKDSS